MLLMLELYSKKIGFKGMKKEKQPRVNPAIQGFNIGINPLGEIVSSMSFDTLNDFLNKNVVDKKLPSKKTNTTDSPLS
jgi:hypothetical protein